jgi:hypothetical protein
MNVLLGINHDADIVQIIGKPSLIVTSTDVDHFLDGIIDPPPINPLRLYWEEVNSPWNAHLANRFATDFKKDLPEISEDQEEIATYFLQRLKTLKKILDKTVIRDNETPDERSRRMEEREQQILAESRCRSRRDRVSNSFIFMVSFSLTPCDSVLRLAVKFVPPGKRRKTRVLGNCFLTWSRDSAPTDIAQMNPRKEIKRPSC